MALEESIIAGKAIAAIKTHISDQSTMPQVNPEYLVDVVNDRFKIRDALEGLIGKTYKDCDLCSNDIEAVANIRAAVSNIKIFMPKVGAELEAVAQLAQKMVEIPELREAVTPRIQAAMRGAAEDKIPQKKVGQYSFKNIARAEKAGQEFAKTENLYLFDGVAGFTRGQGE